MIQPNGFFSFAKLNCKQSSKQRTSAEQGSINPRQYEHVMQGLLKGREGLTLNRLTSKKLKVTNKKGHTHTVLHFKKNTFLYLETVHMDIRENEKNIT